MNKERMRKLEARKRRQEALARTPTTKVPQPEALQTRTKVQTGAVAHASVTEATKSGPSRKTDKENRK